MEFATYQLKDVAYQWYAKWENLRGDDAKQAVQEKFFGAFLDHFFPKSWESLKVKSL